MNGVLLVDDDPIVLIQLRKMIDWDKLDCEFAAEASNGAEAIEMLERFHPQIVITDISMPGINGLDLIQYINKHEYHTKVIAISAFDDFTYVKESLKGGAGDYLLKHQLNSVVLEEAIRGALEKTENEEKERPSYSVKEKKERILYQILHGGLSEREDSCLQEFSLEWLKDMLVLVLCNIDGDGNLDVVYELMDETVKYYQKYQILLVQKGRYLLVFGSEREEHQEIDEVIRQLKTNLKRFCDVDMSFVISDIFHGYQKIDEVLKKGEELLSECYFRGEISFIEHFQKKEEIGIYHLSPSQETEIMNAVSEGISMKEVFSNLFAKLHIEELSKNQIQFFYVEMINLLIRKTNEEKTGAVEEKAVEQETDLYEEFFSMDTVDEMKQYFIEKYEILQSRILQDKKRSAYNEVVRSAVDYINNHYKESISLQEVAQQLSISSSYLSRVFKKEVGINIVNYINQVRIEQAKYLINEGRMSLSEIAYEVGIHNYNYFYMLFKELCDATPSEYIKERRSILKK